MLTQKKIKSPRHNSQTIENYHVGLKILQTQIATPPLPLPNKFCIQSLACSCLTDSSPLCPRSAIAKVHYAQGPLCPRSPIAKKVRYSQGPL